MTKHLLLTAFLATALGLKINNAKKEQVLKTGDAQGPLYTGKGGGKGGQNRNRISPTLEEVSVVEDTPVVQNLRSDGGFAYYGALFVGGQRQVSIYDTGSFEVVILSKCRFKGEKGCCPKSECPFSNYNTVSSGPNFVAANTGISSIVYGSGPVWVKAGSDHMSLSGGSSHSSIQGFTMDSQVTTIAKANVPVQIVVEHNIDLFKSTPMTAIVGVGPGLLHDRQHRMVHQMGIKRFMVCFQENTDENGLWTWNDKDRSKDQNWLVVESTADQFWAAPVHDFRLQSEQTDESVGCLNSCGGVIDTGTSLNTFPTNIVNGIIQKINNGKIKDCSDLSKFPTFMFDMGGHTLSLPPSSYIAAAGKQKTQKKFHEQLAFAPLPMSARDLSVIESAERDGLEAPPVNSCVLMVSSGDYGNAQLATSGGQSEQAQFGDMVIFGMSVFRKYAVQFDLSGDLEHNDYESPPPRYMRFAEASPDCSGPVQGGEFSRKANTLQKVDLDKLRISPLQQRLTPHSEVMGNQFFRKGGLRI